MYSFLLNMWVFGNADEQRLQNYVSKGLITQKEFNQIIATPKDKDAK